MPTAQTGILGMQEDGATGKIVSYQGQALQGLGFMSFVSQAYIQLSGVLTTTRMFAAASSGLYLLTYTLEIVTGAAGGLGTPLVQYFSYDQGAGQLLTAFGSTQQLSATGLAQSGMIWFRSAASDIFIGSTGTGAARYNANLSLFRAS
jgi:hypothetical protein